MARLSKTEALYNAILDNPMAPESDKLKAAMALDAYRKQKGHRDRHGKAKKLLGLKPRQSVREAAPELGSVNTRELDYPEPCGDDAEKTFRIVLLAEGAKVYPKATPAELAEAAKIAAEHEVKRKGWTAELEALFAKFDAKKLGGTSSSR